MSLINKEILPFTANAYDPKKDEFFEVSDENLKGAWNVVCFYPADFSFVCPTELEDLQGQYDKLQELGVNVYSVSTDKIQYTMIGDPSQTITRNFEVLDEELGLAQRGTFIVDPDGVVQAAEINADGIGRDASTLVHKIKAAQYVRQHPGEVCPAKWEEGSETLQPGLDLVGKI